MVAALALVGCDLFTRMAGVDPVDGTTSPSDASVEMSVDADIWIAADAFAALEGAAARNGEGPQYVPDQLIVELKSGKYSDSSVNSLARANGLRVTGKIKGLRLVLVTASVGSDLDALQGKLKSDPSVESVGRNAVYTLFEAEAGASVAEPKGITNDPYMPQQWGLWRIGFDLIPNSVLPGTAPIIAVVDTGVDYTHPDLGTAKVIKGPDYFDGDMDPMDLTGHGTHVAGVAAALNANNLGVAGVSGKSQVLAIRVGEFFIPVFAGAAGITYAAEYTNVKVVNCSWGGYSPDPFIEDAVAYAVGRGKLVVCSAGNDDLSDPTYPASYPGVLGVGATEWDDCKTDWSNWGDYVDIAAPGVAIYSTTPVSGSYFYAPSYDESDGTSMASPFVAGAAALVWGKWPTMTAQQVANLLIDTASTPLCTDSHGDAFPCGTGRLDLYAAWLAKSGSIPAAPGAIAGIAIGAATNMPIAGATVTATRTGGGIVKTATTRFDGTYTVTELTPGNYTVAAAKSTYITTPFLGAVGVASAGISQDVNFALPMTQAAGTYTVVVSWMDWCYTYSDLDSYLWLPGTLVARKQYMISYWDKGNPSVHPFARLARDSLGPTAFYAESIVFRGAYAGKYSYAVNDFTGQYDCDWACSHAIVRVYKGGVLLSNGVFPLPGNVTCGDWWPVFQLTMPAGTLTAGIPGFGSNPGTSFPGPYGLSAFNAAVAGGKRK
jgi:hypothetical protein